MNCYWLLRSLDYFRLHYDKETLSHWGSPGERKIYKNLVYRKRRQEWLLGRLTAKELIQRYFRNRYAEDIPFYQIEVLNKPSGQPYFQVAARQKLWGSLSLVLSITHCRNLSVCALAELNPSDSMGVDLEYVAPRPSLFTETFYHVKEIAQLNGYNNQQYQRAVTAIWSLKEAALKALGQGLRLDTHKVVVELPCPPWFSWSDPRIRIDLPGVKPIKASMRFFGSYVLTWAQVRTGRNSLPGSVRNNSELHSRRSPSGRRSTMPI